MEKINKIKTCIQVWKSRDLTFKGKVLVIKTLLLSQIGFQSETVTIPNNFVKDIDTFLWSFLWDGKQPLVSNNTMYLDKELGGVNMPNIRNILMSKQIKSVYKILMSNNAHSNITGKDWLKKFDNEYNDNFFLGKCSNIKGLNISDLPDFYQCDINSWSFSLSKKKLNDRSYIMNANLFGFSMSNIKTVRDIWDVNTKTFYTDNYIRNVLIE